MNRLLLTIALLLAACSSPRRGWQLEEKQRVADPASARTIAQGPLVGFGDAFDTYGYLGIPYAQPPVGALRWRAPRPPAPWTEPRQALKFGSACVQFGSLTGAVSEELYGKPIGSEDCLTLNVWAPKRAEKLPVMLWIHGGGNSVGTSATYTSAPNLAGQKRVVVVTISYRLGVLGWFRHPALASGDATPEDRSGNYATLDQLRALEWVRDNIAQFGGDPGNVTVFGESAGGTNVYALLVSPRAKGLFHRAIAQSGVPGSASIASAEKPLSEGGADFSSAELVSAWTAGKPVADLATFLRGLSPAELLAPYPNPGAFGMYHGPFIIRDGVVLPEAPFLEVLSDPSRYNAVPVIVGTNRDEYKLFMAFNPEFVNVWFGRLPRIRDPEAYDRAARYISQAWKALGADLPATRMRQGGNEHVWAYRFDWDEEPKGFLADLSRLIGAAHAMEIPFVFLEQGKDAFGLTTEENRPGRAKLAEAMASYWTALARDGRPGTGGQAGLPEWKRWSVDGPDKFIVFDTDQGGGVRMAGEEQRLEQLAAALEADPGFKTVDDRCRVYARTFGIFGLATQQWSKDDYLRFAGGACRGLPFEKAMAPKK